jgi:hypothetical protein
MQPARSCKWLCTPAHLQGECAAAGQLYTRHAHTCRAGVCSLRRPLNRDHCASIFSGRGTLQRLHSARKGQNLCWSIAPGPHLSNIADANFLGSALAAPGSSAQIAHLQRRQSFRDMVVVAKAVAADASANPLGTLLAAIEEQLRSQTSEGEPPCADIDVQGLTYHHPGNPSAACLDCWGPIGASHGNSSQGNKWHRHQVIQTFLSQQSAYLLSSACAL